MIGKKTKKKTVEKIKDVIYSALYALWILALVMAYSRGYIDHAWGPVGIGFLACFPFLFWYANTILKMQLEI